MRILSHRPQTPDYGFLPTERDAANARLRWRIANARRIEDGPEPFADLPESDR